MDIKNILSIGFFSISEDACYSKYRFFHRFRKMFFEAEIIDSIF